MTGVSAPAEAFPLAWPAGWSRTPPTRRARSQFQTTEGRARDHLVRQVQLLGGRGLVLSTNVPVRRDGLPYANARRPEDPGVAAYWQQRVAGELVWRVVACDRWVSVGENIRAIGLTLEAMRGLERWGASDILNRVFAGFAALPAQAAERPWWIVLGFDDPAGISPEAARDAYRRLARELHPDRGGSTSAMAALNAAWSEYRKANPDA